MTEPRVAPRGALLLACALATATAWAQPAVPSASAASAAEKAQKETDRTMYWIRVLASKPAVKPAAAPAPVAAVTPAPRPAAPAPVATAAAAKPAAETREKAKSAPPPATTVVAAAQEAAPPIVGKTSTPAQAPAREVSEPLAAPSINNGVDTGAPATPAASAALPVPDVASPPAEEPDPGLIQIESAQPDFPTAIVRRVHKGNVEVHFEVEPGGKVVEATVVESSHPRLDDAAIEAVKKWRFKPGTRYHTAAVNLKFDIDTE